MARLKELRLKNFKSFKKARVPFKKGFTTIIGPNGSGKSNLLDALLFSLGTTSMKMLRASRLSELVNNSAAEKYGKVEITVKDNEKEWEISRTIDKKGKCIYRLNGEKKGLNEITSLLVELSIKNDGHNIVAQGDVTRIIEMNPEQRRGIIDELAGIREFELKKEEAHKELEKVNQKLKEANLILADRIEHLKRLEEERAAALEFRELEERKKRAKATLLKEELNAAKEKIKKHKKKLAGFSALKKEFQEKVAELDEKLEKAESEAEEMGREIITAQKESVAKIVSALEEKKSSQAILQEKISSKENQILSAEARESRLNERLKELKEEKNSLQQELREIEEELPVKKRLSEKLEKELGEFEKKQSEAVKKLREKESALRERVKKAEQLREAAFALESEKGVREKENEMLRKNVSEAKERLEALESEVKKNAEKESTLKALREEKIQEQLSAVEERILKRIEKEKEISAGIAELEKAAGELKKEIAKCPVCESPLDGKKKAALREKKEKETRALRFKEKKVQADLKELREKRNELLKKRKEMEELIPLAEALKEKRASARSLRERISSLREAFRNLSPLEKKAAEKKKEFEEERERNKSEAFALEKEKERILSRESDLREQFIEARNSAKMLEQQKSGILKETERAKRERGEAVKEIDFIQKEKKEKESGIAELGEKAEKISAEIEKMQSEKERASKEMEEKIGKRESAVEKISMLREKKQALELKGRARNRESQDLRVEIGKLEVRAGDLEEEFREFAETKTLKGLNAKELRAEIPATEKRIRELGAINLKALESFGEEKQELMEINKKVEKLSEERDAVLEMIEKIEIKRNNVFMDCFMEIEKNFSKMFYSFFSGKGSLALTDEENPTESGLIISAKHKGENLVNIDAMSGGEKSLTALAFLFAIQLYEPAPFYVFDEADAALDEENSLKLVKIIKEISRESQFIAITHNNSLIKEADLIVGVTLDKNKSSVIGLDLKQKIMEKNSA